MNDDRYIKIKIYTYFTRRVKIYAPKALDRFLKYISLNKTEYAIYLQTLVTIGKVIEELGYEEKTEIYIRPWLLWFWYPFAKGAFRKPVVIIEEYLVRAGRVPSSDEIREIMQKVEKKK